ncbi:MAG TPA: transaldolase [Chloroflexi bacterium]|nr:transaldolase [Chloroflexota bacterium]
MSRISQLYQLGQSIWLDFIERSMIQNGKLQALVDDGVSGVTSNPTIFQQAIVKSDAYNDDLRRLAASAPTPKAVFEGLAIADIQAAADILRPVYEANQGHDGFVSLEVAPDLAFDATATIAEARRLHAAVARPNLMVKVPATLAGVPAIRQLIADGININVTLIFSLERYAAVKEAFIAGLEDRLAARKPIDRIASVASFFVSRVDVNIDSQLDRLAAQHPDRAVHYKALQGKAAVANAKLAYAQFQQVFTGARWERLAAAGARVQRPLWASTSTKNPAYPDLIYVEPLMGPHTVNTMPPQTLEALKDHGTVALTVTQGVDAARQALADLAAAGIDMNAVTTELEQDGVKKFADSFVDLLKVIEERSKVLAPA